MSEARSEQECDDDELKDVDSLGELSELSDDEDMESGDDDFVVSDDDELGVVLDDAAWDAEDDLVFCEGLHVPRKVLEMWAQITSAFHVVSAQRTLSSSLCRMAPLIRALELRGSLVLRDLPLEELSSPALLHHLVPSPHQPLSFPVTVKYPSRTTCAATTLSALETFRSSVETHLSSTGSIELSHSRSPSPLECLCGQVILGVVLTQLAQEALRSCSSTPPK